MVLGKALLACTLLLVASLPASSAQPGQVVASTPSTACVASASGAAPPCGYIVPQLALDFPDKPACKSASLGGAVDLSKCLKLPAKGQSVKQDGILRWYWDITQDGDYPIDPMTPIVIQFTGTATNPKWLSIKVDPESFTLDAVAMGNPQNLKTDPAKPQVWFWFEKPISVTITRTGDPSPAELTKIANAGGVQKIFLKAKSNASGAYYKEAFGVEEFRFNAYSDPAITPAASSSKGSPGLGPLALLGALALALVAVRRRS